MLVTARRGRDSRHYNEPMIRTGIIGGTGYTGAELIRLLLEHPQAELARLTSRRNAGRPVGEVFPHFAGKTDLVFSEALDDAAELDAVFVAAPNGVAMEDAPALLEAGVKVIDLSADFRIKDAAVWERWYGQKHACPERLPEAVYGLPELHRDLIKEARLIANPGCYPTSVILGCAPLLKAGLIDPGLLIADSKSGVSGAGRGAQTHLLSAEVDGNFMAYGVSGHRHFPEIAQCLDGLVDGAVGLSFTPHLVPMTRGIFSTLYFKTDETLETLHRAMADAWKDEPFVAVLNAGGHPKTRTVRGTNECQIAVHKTDGGVGKVLSVIDNLLKGASGQALQNMNLMFGLDETAGLEGRVALYP